MPDPAQAAPALRRHALAWLAPGAWEALRRAHDAAASAAGGMDPVPDAAENIRACLGLWAARDWPLVVARQEGAAGGVALGLPAPARWGRRRIGVRVAAGDIVRRGSFPAPAAVDALLPADAREEWRRLAAGLEALGTAGAVYGSYGWQALTGLDYLHAGSDLDLCLPVHCAAQADRVADRLEAASGGTLPRLDGELMRPDGAAVAWREWRRWRAGGMAGAVMVRRIDGPALVRGADWLGMETVG